MRAGFALMIGLAFMVGAGSPASGQETGETEESADGSSAAPERPPADGGRPDDASLRKAPARRKKAGRPEFDPKVFEARGRELQGEYYEIASFAKAPAWSSAPEEAAAMAPEASPRGRWLLWTGAAGLTAIVAGAAGYLYLESADPEEPETVLLDDKP